MPGRFKWVPPVTVLLSAFGGAGTVAYKGGPWWSWTGIIVVGAGASGAAAIIAEYKQWASHQEARADAEAKLRHNWVSQAGALMIALGVTNWVLENVRAHLKNKPELLAQVDERIKANKTVIEAVEKFKTRPE